MAILFIIGMFLFMFSLIFGGIVGPIWGIIQCATSDRSPGSKAGWIISLFFLGPIAVLVFAFSGASKWFRILCAWPMLLTVLLLAIALGFDSEFRHMFVEQYKLKMQRVPTDLKG